MDIPREQPGPLRLKPAHVLRGHKSWSRSCAIANSPYASVAVSVGDDSVGRVWDASSGQQKAVLSGHLLNVKGTAVSMDGLVAATAGRDGSVRVWNTETGQQIWKLDFKGGTTSEGCAITPDGFNLVAIFSNKLLWKQGKDCWLVACNVKTKQTMYTWHFAPADIVSCVVSHDGAVGAVVMFAKHITCEVRVIDMKTGSALKRWPCGLDLKPGVAIDAVGGRVLIANGRQLCLCCVQGNEAAQVLTTRYEYNACDMSANGERAVASNQFNVFHVWDVTRRYLLAALDGHTMRTRGLAISLDGRKVVTSSDDCLVRIWDLCALDTAVNFSGQKLLQAPEDDDCATTNETQRIPAYSALLQGTKAPSEQPLLSETQRPQPYIAPSVEDLHSQPLEQEPGDSLELSDASFKELQPIPAIATVEPDCCLANTKEQAKLSAEGFHFTDDEELHICVTKVNAEHDWGASIVKIDKSPSSNVSLSDHLVEGNDIGSVRGLNALRNESLEDQNTDQRRVSLDDLQRRSGQMVTNGEFNADALPVGSSSSPKVAVVKAAQLHGEKDVPIIGLGGGKAIMLGENHVISPEDPFENSSLGNAIESPELQVRMDQEEREDLARIRCHPSAATNRQRSSLSGKCGSSCVTYWPMSNVDSCMSRSREFVPRMSPEVKRSAIPWPAREGDGIFDRHYHDNSGKTKGLSEMWRLTFETAAGCIDSRISVRQAAKITVRIAKSGQGDIGGRGPATKGIERSSVELLYSRYGCVGPGAIVSWEMFIAVAFEVMYRT